jgi:hypothetical protein
MTNPSVYVDNELFLGRLDEQERFRETLRTVLMARDDDAPPFIFLLHGEGGMGKSQLTRRLYDIATTEPPFERGCQALRVDWELVRNNTPALRVARDQIHPEEVLAALHRGHRRQYRSRIGTPDSSLGPKSKLAQLGAARPRFGLAARRSPL